MYEIFRIEDVVLKCGWKGEFLLSVENKNYLLPFYCDDLRLLWKTWKVYQMKPEVEVYPHGVYLYFAQDEYFWSQFASVYESCRSLLEYIDGESVDTEMIEATTVSIHKDSNRCLNPFMWVTSEVSFIPEYGKRYGQYTREEMESFFQKIQPVKELIKKVSTDDVPVHGIEHLLFELLQPGSGVEEYELYELVLMALAIGTIKNFNDEMSVQPFSIDDSVYLSQVSVLLTDTLSIAAGHVLSYMMPWQNVFAKIFVNWWRVPILTINKVDFIGSEVFRYLELR